MNNKGEMYASLVDQRHRCRLCRELVNPSAASDGQYDSDEIGPWSRWQGNLDAPLMVVGQDWGDVRYFENNRGVEGGKNPTNDMLRELLASIGIEIGPPGNSALPQRVFFTNAILCLKTEGGLQGAVHPSWFSNCGPTFLRPLIEIIRPTVVVCLGERAWSAVTTAFGQSPGAFRRAVESDGTLLATDIRAVAVYHCGARILNTHRKREQQFADWARVGRLLGMPAGVTELLGR